MSHDTSESPFQENSPLELCVPSTEVIELARVATDDFEMAVARDYARLGELALEAIQAPKSQDWFRSCAPQDLLRKLAGRFVVDVGCGVDGGFRRLLGEYAVGDYLGVDLLPDTSETRIWSWSQRFAAPRTQLDPSTDGIGGIILHADALTTLARLPDSSVSVVLNGIDDLIIDADTPYGAALIGQIDRAVSVGGTILGCTGWGGILPKFQDLPGYTSQRITGHDGAWFMAFHKT